MKYIHYPVGILAVFCLLLFFLSCNDDEGIIDNGMTGKPDVDNPIGMGGEMEQDTSTMTSSMKYLELDSDYIFDQDKLPTFYLELPSEHLARLDADPAAEEYEEGKLIFEGDTLAPVGIRYKGSIGAFVNCLSGNNWADPSGFKTCTKLSMKVKINWDGRTDKFYGLKKLQFHSMNLDPSQMRERLGYWLFREMGVPAPRCVHARLVINGVYVGLFALVEQIDGRFTRYNWDDGEGNLYKEIWPLSSNKQAFSDAEYKAALKTNEDENPSVDIMREFGEAIAAASPSEVNGIIESYMDIREILSYAVVDRAIKHDDGPFHWYCNGGDCESHNFYWYEEPATQQLHLIAWDMDNAFENITTANPVTNIADAWGEISNDCQPFRHGPFFLSQLSAACDPLTAGWASYTDEYDALRETLITGPLSTDEADAQVIKWAAQVREATLDASNTHDDAVSIISWENGIGQLLGQLEIARR